MIDHKPDDDIELDELSIHEQIEKRAGSDACVAIDALGIAIPTESPWDGVGPHRARTIFKARVIGVDPKQPKIFGLFVVGRLVAAYSMLLKVWHLRRILDPNHDRSEHNETTDAFWKRVMLSDGLDPDPVARALSANVNESAAQRERDHVNAIAARFDNRERELLDRINSLERQLASEREREARKDALRKSLRDRIGDVHND